MGCDIHLVLEKRHGDKWVGVDTFTGHHRGKFYLKEGERDYSSPVTRQRNYERFALLAGVRGDGPPPRGVPSDASDTTGLLIQEWGTDGHSHSWLPLSEAVHVWSLTQSGMDKFSEDYPAVYFFGVDTSDGSGDKNENYRVVFWFDN